ncbi:MAG TPA: TIGR00730 family Rossman fold protein [Blastocatellia bacterium]|nr:TIGR00730 family Rossman fold protein [Blastocatellia bacterium]
MQRISVFCGSSTGNRQSYSEAARALGLALCKRDIELVYGGGGVGLMGVIADAVLAAGGRVIGVIPEDLVAKEVGHKGLTDLRVVRSMHERKAMMAALSDAFIALPGGYGTFEEFCEVITWGQLGLHRKPCGVLNVDGYYSPLLSFFDQAVVEGFVFGPHRRMVIEQSDPDLLLDLLSSYQAPATIKWVDRKNV